MKAPIAKTSKGLLASRAGRWVFAGLLFFAFILLILGRVNHPAIDKMRAVASDFSSPILGFLSRPVDRMDAAFEWAGSLTSLVAENTRLRAENERLLQWQSAALALERENLRLRALLNAPELASKRVATPRVVGVSGGPFVRSVMINAGRVNGVARDQVVVDELGLVGRVFAAGRVAARVLLVTDLNSRVPVRLQRTGDPAIARGRNDASLELVFLPPGAEPRLNDAVVTTGEGGIFPPDILLGHVDRVDGQGVGVRPIALLDRLEFVQVIEPVSSLLKIRPEEQGGNAPAVNTDPQAKDAEPKGPEAVPQSGPRSGAL
ncbi:cell shape-determining protein MreC [Iodidimonas muriae]|uniref:Cell shape-determining protein MreC n=1 Tax=Iodidimonas muriae TaxID=261467 RepID=A0ABQ2LER9_9PROT|nr:rod shape-determining protein MreC [Iodidimonas muriae]GER07550.1 cell shape-determining protein MreC [Kordiimonadales bacterium JCM 17843]GGO14024.1 cell shape-determining protein MreC [Iodidimonas muriae]